MLRFLLPLFLLLPSGISPRQATKAAQSSAEQVSYPRLLSARDLTEVLPATVFFQGRSAPVQARNSAGIEFSKSAYLLVALVDASGYSTSIQERYQAYLITEEPVDVGGHLLAAGAYGCGFMPGSIFLVMDLGGHQLFAAPTEKDAALKRPSPLQMLGGPDAGSFRLFAGRTFVVIKPHSKS